jgi:hypothetical protein
VNVPLDALNLRNFNYLFHMLNLRNVDLNNLLLGDGLRHMTHILDRLHWTWHVNMPLDILHLRYFDNLVHVLDLRDMNMMHNFFSDSNGHVPHLLDNLNRARHMDVSLHLLDLWDLDDFLNMLNLRDMDLYDFLLHLRDVDVLDDFTFLRWGWTSVLT